MVNVTIALYLVRHGLSCANVLDGCTADLDQADRAFSAAAFAAIDRELAPTRFARAAGYRAANADGGDCALVRRPSGDRVHWSWIATYFKENGTNKHANAAKISGNGPRLFEFRPP